MHIDKKLRRKAKNKLEILAKKFKIVKPLSRAIQSTKTIPLASLKAPERIPVINIRSNARNWYIESKLYREKLIIVFHVSGIFITFYSWNHVHYEVLRLTIMFN